MPAEEHARGAENPPGRRSVLWRAVRALVSLAAVGVAHVVPARRALLVWGPTPILSNRYWSTAMREAGWKSVTVMEGVYPINTRADFDHYTEELVPGWLRRLRLAPLLAPAAALLWVVRNARVVHIPFTGGMLGGSKWWRLEGNLLQRKGIRTVVMPYGGDAYLYSRVMDTSLRMALQMSYPQNARRERHIAERASYWTERADAMITGTMVDGLGRTDVINVQPCCIDTRAWSPASTYSTHDGRSGPVRVLHTPNHRGFKGTEFLLRAVEQLRGEGLQIELILLERVPNEVVRETMRTVDLVAEQFIASIYGLSGIEGMASGLPVLVSMGSEPHTRPFRRYSYLEECPAFSTSPETLTADLRRLVTDPGLRKALGRAGRQYVEKYHSFATAQYMFGAIYRRILDGEEVDLLRLFDPVQSAYVTGSPRVEHPMIEGRPPAI